MGSWASLNVRGQDVFHWKSEVDPTFLFLFTQDDVTYAPVEDQGEDPYANPTLIVRSTAGILADRLDALGISASDLAACLEVAIDERIDNLNTWYVDLGDELAERALVAVGDLQALTFDEWVSRVAKALPLGELSGPKFNDYTRLDCLMELWEPFDPRWLLRALLVACRPEDEVVLDLTDLELGGYLEAFDLDPQTAAAVMFSTAALHGTPAVVITEGSTDSEFLRAAIEIRRPHLARFVRFFEAGVVAGGAGSALTTVKAFAAAGINNRVIVLLDNDTAARDAVRGLSKVTLPGHYAIAHLPELDLARDYPTSGPTGQQRHDVNGLAGSIELYLGRDVLIDPKTGVLRPVIWRSRIDALEAYQGEVTGKAAIHDAFRAKVAQARCSPEVLSDQDWTGLDTVLDALVDHLRQCGVANPAERGLGRS